MILNHNEAFNNSSNRDIATVIKFMENRLLKSIINATIWIDGQEFFYPINFMIIEKQYSKIKNICSNNGLVYPELHTLINKFKNLKNVAYYEFYNVPYNPNVSNVVDWYDIASKKILKISDSLSEGGFIMDLF